MTALPRSAPSRLALGAAVAGAALVAPLAVPAPAGAASRDHHSVAALPPHALLVRATGGVSRARVLALAGSVRLGNGHLGFHIVSSTHRSEARGSLVSHASQLGFQGQLRFVEHHGAVYIRAGLPFWRREAAKGLPHLTAAQRTRAERLLATRWVEMTGTSAHAMRTSLGVLTNPDAFARQLLAPHALGSLHKGRPTRFRRHLAVPIHSSKGGTLFVTAQGATRPLALVAHRGSGGGTILFGYPRHALKLHAPRGAWTIARVVHAVTT